MQKSYKEILKEELKNKNLLLKQNPRLNESSGIYILTREENGYKFAYVGQAKHILTRLAQHFVGWQVIDRSLRKHGLYSEDNPCGYKVAFFNCNENELDEKETEYIKKSIEGGYILRNLTLGSQGKGKQVINAKEGRGYRDGLAQGYKNARRDVAKLFEKNLTFGINGTPNKNKQKSYDKFNNFINESEKEE